MTERIDSLKAGALGAIAAGLGFSLVVLAQSWLFVPLGLQLQLGLSSWDGWQLGLAMAIALCSGALFGITYRYVVRQDDNPHLRSGAILSFGLVRGLAQVDGGQLLQGNVWPAGIGVAESLWLFAIAATVIDWGIAWGWLKPQK